MTKLQAIRKKNLISKFDLAKKTDLYIQLIQKYEQRKLPIEGCQLESLLNICTVLNCRPWDIIEDENLCRKLKSFLILVQNEGV